MSEHPKDPSSGMLHPHTHAKLGNGARPLVIEKGEGVYVFDDAGKRYLEGAAGLWCVSLGFGNERLAKVAYDAIRDLGYYHTFRHATPSAALALSEALLKIAPEGMSHTLLQCSGSEANDTAVKLVWYYWNAKDKPAKRKIISRKGSYHGSTVASVCLTGKPEFHAGFGMPFPEFLYVDGHNYPRAALPDESEEAYGTRLANALDAMILKEGPDTIAAMWIEPAMSGAGVYMPPKGYYEKVQAILHKYDILLVVDEVICGFGRTGEMWGSQTFGLKPDLIPCAKALSSGMQPISALLINDRVHQGMVTQSDRLGRFVHGYTYAGHPAAAAVALETLKIYEEMDLIGHVKAVEKVFVEEMTALTEHPMVGLFQASGLIGGMEIVADKATGAPFASELKVPARLEEKAKELGLILRFVGNRIAFSPPLIINPAEIREMASILKDALDAIWTGL